METERGSVTVLKWEKFMPRKVMRVLLVEADDSTRQAVASLLSKCGYKVEAVADGLKAWEVLKAKPRNVDLILAEVDLPSISGFALLTLVMEHDICKNVPVIMMSSVDSVGTVYKCMLRGSADFLVKPIRTNELKTLWQHVWRRRSLASWPHIESVSLGEAEATAENNASSNQISETASHVQKDEEFTEKGTDGRSSSIKAALESGTAQQQQSPEVLSFQKNIGPPLGSGNFASFLSLSKEVKHDVDQRNENIASECPGDNNVSTASCIEAIDLIGTFDNHHRGHRTDSSFHRRAINLELSLQLDLSLKRSGSHGDDILGTGEMLILKHSGGSAFSRYINKSLHTERELSHDANGYTSDTPSPVLSTPTSILSLANTQSELPIPFSRHRAFPASIPVTVLRSDSLSAEFGSEFPNPSTDSQQDPSLKINTVNLSIPKNNNSSDLESSNYPLTLNSTVDQRHFSPSSDRSAITTFHSNSGSICESNASVSRVFLVTTGKEGMMEGGPITQNGNSQQSLQREAALKKFRLKRKLRCFDKKVRYESRKKLAEQRPRIKGQFVRQLDADPVPKEIDQQ